MKLLSCLSFWFAARRDTDGRVRRYNAGSAPQGHGRPCPYGAARWQHILVLLLLLCTFAFAQDIENLPLEDPVVPAQIEESLIEEAPIEDPSVPSAPTEDFHRHDDAEPLDSATVADPNAFVWQAFYAGALVALMCGFLGLYVVLRRMVFIGVALAEISSAGIALSLLAGPMLGGTALAFLVPHGPILGALAFVLTGVALLSVRWTPRLLPPDAPVGVFYLLATAAGILMIAKSAQGESHMLTLLRGDVLAVYPHETLQMAVVFVVLGVVHWVFGKEFLLVSLDRDAAATQGLRAGRFDFLLLLTIGVAVSLSIRSVGVLLTASLLIFPAATALLVAPRWRWAAILAPLTGVAAVALGLYLSLVGDFPASAVIVALLFALLTPALLFKTFGRKS